MNRLVAKAEAFFFGHRWQTLGVIGVFTAVMAVFALQLHMSAGFEKQMPIGHEYIQTFEKYRGDLFGANRLNFVVKARKGTIWNQEALTRLYDVTQAVMYLPGVDRIGVQSLWTPNAYVNEITEEGFRADQIIDSTITPEALTPEIVSRIQKLTSQGGFVGTLVAHDQTSAMITAEVEEVDREGKKLDYVAYNRILEEKIRKKFEDGKFEIQIIGFAKQIGDIADGASGVLEFCGIALVLTALAVYWYCRSVRFTILPIVCSLTSLVWQFGTLRLLGYGLDPLAVLVPFLVFAIGVSHGVQQINFIVRGLAHGKSTEEAARESFTGLLIPGTLALITAIVSFITLVLIPIPMVRELAITASIGVTYKIFTNLLMLPVAASLFTFTQEYADGAMLKREKRSRWLHVIAKVAEPRNAVITLVITAAIFGTSVWQSRGRVIGTLLPGAPELRPDARFNRDAVAISEAYDMGLDWLTVVFEAPPASDRNAAIGAFVNEFTWKMSTVPGVMSVDSYSNQLSLYNEGYNEGNPKMAVVPVDPGNTAGLNAEIARLRGYMSKDASMTAAHMYLTDHKAVTINRVIQAVKEFREHPPPREREDTACGGERGGAGGDQRRGGEERAPDDAVRVRRDPHPGLPRLPRRAGDGGVLHAAGRGDVHRVLVHEGTEHRAHGGHPPGDGPRGGDRGGLRLLHLQPAAASPGPGVLHLPGDGEGARLRGDGDHLHGDHAGGRRGHLVVLAAQVPGGHGEAPRVHVPGEHDHGDDRPSGAGRGPGTDPPAEEPREGFRAPEPLHRRMTNGETKRTDMMEIVHRGRRFGILTALALSVFLACPANAREGDSPPASGAGAAPASLKIQPAEATTAATKAMILSSARAGKRIVAVGNHGIVLLSDTDGADFRQAKSVPVRSTLSAVFFVDDKTGWAVGQWGVVLRTDDAGESWTLQRHDTSVDQPLFSVWFRDRQRGYAVGLWSLLIATVDGGKTWTQVTLPPPPGGKKADRNLLKIFANRMGTLFIAAEQGMILKSYDGENWSYISTGYKGSFWTGIVLNNGTLLVGGLRGTIYRSADDGRSWREAKSEFKSSITDFAEAGGKVYAAGLDGVFLESDNGGATFKGSQREDRLPFTAISVNSVGKLVKFSKQGVVKDPPNEPSK